MKAVTSSVNKAKGVLQLNIAPRNLKALGATAFAAQLREAACLASDLKASGEAKKVVVIIDGNGATECGSSSLQALGQLFSLEDCSLLDSISSVLLINADSTLKAAWAVAKLMEPAKRYAPLVRVLD
jgi:hypothetical protein